MTAEEIALSVAKVSPKRLEELSKFINQLCDDWEEGKPITTDYERWTEAFTSLPDHQQVLTHLILCYETMLNSVIDPKSNALDWNQAMMQAFKDATKLRRLLTLAATAELAFSSAAMTTRNGTISLESPSGKALVDAMKNLSEEINECDQ